MGNVPTFFFCSVFVRLNDFAAVVRVIAVFNVCLMAITLKLK